MLLYGYFTYVPILVHLRDLDGRALAVLPFTETLRHARRQTPVVNATQFTLVIFPGGRTGWGLLASNHHCDVGVVAHETMTGDSDRERRLQMVRDMCLDDESLEPAHVYKRQIPAVRERRERVHVRRGQGQTRVGVCVDEASHHFRRDGRVEDGETWKKPNFSRLIFLSALVVWSGQPW